MSSNAPQIPIYWATSPGKAPQQPLPKEPESAEPSPAGPRHQVSQSQPLVSNPAFIESEPIDISSAAPTRQSTVRRGPSNEIQRYYYVESEPGAPLRRSEDMPGPPRSIYAGENRRLYRDAYPDRDIWYDDDPRRPPRANGYRRRPIGIRPPPPPPSVAEPNLRVRRSYEAGPSPKRVLYSEDDGVYYYSDDDEASLKRGIDPQGEYYYHAGRGAGGGGGGGHGRGAGGGGMKDKPPSEVLRLPWTMWMNSNAKNHFVAAMGEFVGTTMFLFFAFAGTQVGATAGMKTMTVSAAAGKSPDVLLYISLIFAFSLMVNVWIFFRISGGLFNPAVTLAMLMTRTISAARAILLTVAQLAGSIFASFLVKVMFPQKLDVRTTLSDDTSIARGIFIEAVLTAELVFTIFMLAKEKHKATFIAPVGIGLALFIAELVGVYYTGGSLNPARSFGPCVVTGVFESEHWIYWLGPAIGALFALAFYKFIKILEYEMANPGQDADYHPPKTDVESQHKGGKQGPRSSKHESIVTETGRKSSVVEV